MGQSAGSKLLVSKVINSTARVKWQRVLRQEEQSQNTCRTSHARWGNWNYRANEQQRHIHYVERAWQDRPQSSSTGSPQLDQQSSKRYAPSFHPSNTPTTNTPAAPATVTADQRA